MAAEIPGDAQIHIGTKFKYDIRREHPPYLQNNSTCKFTSEICMVLFHNVKNMMTGGNGI